LALEVLVTDGQRLRGATLDPTGPAVVGHAGRGGQIVLHAVAVVVDAVTHLGLGIERQGGTDRLGPIGGALHQPLTNAGAETSLAALAQIGECLVEEAVTVVVDGVAQLLHGGLGASTDHLTLLAHLIAHVAGPELTGGARHTLYQGPLVHQAVAVLVHPVAHLVPGDEEVITDQTALPTGPNPLGTLTGSLRVTQLPVLGDGLIGVSVAVIVHGVAGLVRGRRLRLAGPGTAFGTDHQAGGAATQEPRVTLSAHRRAVFVHLAVAVIVQRVALFGARWS
jgi:hypothetical protein